MSLDYTKLTVSEIKSMLVQEGRYDEESLEALDVKGKAQWVELHKNFEVEDEIDDAYATFSFDSISDELDNVIENVTPMEQVVDEDTTTNIPFYNSPEWNDYVLSQFTPEELIDGKYPNVNSLRRVAELLLGDIVYSGPINVQCTMDPAHTGKAVVTYQVTIDWKLDQYYGTTGIAVDTDFPQRNFIAVASSWVGNTDNDFASFPEAIAETRAEGRALRRALRLNVVCSDELTKKDTAAIVEQQQSSVDTTGEWDEDAMITDHQITLITVMCERLGIDLNKFINSGELQYQSISDIKKGRAGAMLNELNRFQNSGDDSKAIPNNLLIGE